MVYVATYLVKSTLEPSFPLGAIVPFLVNYSKCDIFIRRPSHKSNEASVFLSSCCKRLATFSSMLSLYTISWGLRFIDQIGVEYIEFVTLDNLRRWVVMIIMSLVVFIPLIAHLYTIEIPRLAWAMLPCPLGTGTCGHGFFAGKYFFILSNAPRKLSFVKSSSGLGEVLIRDRGETA